ncbi:MAG: hypothetical protein OER88_04805 [Planctomycetota bacterium]|nr:hypothetical protein [Planctomycetota bacterium]
MESPWIRSKRWDLGWLVFSVLTVPLAPLMHHYLDMSAEGVATVIMLLVGGPHVFVTFTRTNMDPKFVRRHRTFTRLAYLVPIATAAFALYFKAAFLTFFFTFASLHVLQQISYVANCYSNRQKLTPTGRERLFEYGVIFSCLYPFAAVRMVEGTFTLDGTALLVPEFLLGDGLIYAAFAIFAVFLGGWLFYVVRRHREQRLHYGKTGLIAVTVFATLFTPLFRNLDVAFQGINTWHCVQYLALIWWANRLRRERGETELAVVRAISERGWKGFARYYGLAVLATLGLVGAIYLAAEIPGVTVLLAYYMLGKGVLLTHYYYDTFLFTQNDELTQPAPALVTAF